MAFPVFDLHCDTALTLLGPSLTECGSLRTNDKHIALDRAKAFPGYAQCFACFTTTEPDECKIPPVDIFEREMTTVLREVDKNSDLIRHAFTAEDVLENQSDGIMSAILTIEGPAGFGFDAALLEDLYNVGFRITTLGWNEKNPLTGSHATGGRLTDLGRAYVKEAQRLGMLIDVSHISDEGFWDIMDITQGPVIASHSNSRNIHPVSRNLTDDMFKAICDTDGIVGINLYADFLGDKPNLDTVCDHIEHFLTLDPSGKHIGLGGDLDGCERLPEGFEGVQDYQKLADKLLKRGLSSETVYDIFWNNAIGVMKRAVSNHQG
jgi:membrane dipeptidase